MLRKRVKTHVLEKVVLFFMVLFGSSSIYIFLKAVNLSKATGQQINPMVAIIEILMIVLIVSFANIWVSIKIYEQHKP